MTEIEVFDNWADTYDASVARNTTLYARYDDVLDAVVAAARVGPGMRVLDIGVGTGNLALRCLEAGADVVGLDPSEGMLRVARAKIGKNPLAELVKADDPFLEIPYPDGSFDAVVSTYAYHHVPEDRKPRSVEEMFRVLKPGGSLAIGDLMFESRDALNRALATFDWLEEENFAIIDMLELLFAGLGAKLTHEQFTPVTWVISAIRCELLSGAA